MSWNAIKDLLSSSSPLSSGKNIVAAGVRGGMTARPRSDIEVQLIIKRWPAEVGQLQQRYRRREKHAIHSKTKCKRMSCFSEDMIITYYGLSEIISRLQESKQQMSKQAVFQFWLTVSVMWSITQQTGTLSVLLLYTVRIASQNSKNDGYNY